MSFFGCRSIVLTAALLSISDLGQAQTAIFDEPGFPVVDSEALSRGTLTAALGGDAKLLGVESLRSGAALDGITLLVLPYGSAFPADAWPGLQAYLRRGGNLLILGGQPFRVPVRVMPGGGFRAEDPQDSYSRALGLLHSYPVPLPSSTMHFHWKQGYDFMPALEIRVARVFAQEGRLQGLGYLDEEDGTHAAAPVIVMDRGPKSSMPGSRIVALPFKPAPGYLSTEAGMGLIRAAANYARAGATSLQIEAKYSALHPGEKPELTVHLHHPSGVKGGSVEVELTRDGRLVEDAHLSAGPSDTDLPFVIRKVLPKGTYAVRARWTPDGSAGPQESAENGFEVEDLALLERGDALAVDRDFLTLAGKPFFPVGTNYFSTEDNGWDFSGPRNAAVWERDFADMERHGVNFVRTGVWMGVFKLIDPSTGGANERFLRNLEAFLAAAQRHHICVNFTFFAFTPRVTEQESSKRSDSEKGSEPTRVPNPYLNPGSLQIEKRYVSSIVERFGRVPWLSYDLINEPSFSNPGTIFHGNLPNGDLDELGAWQTWLQERYPTLDRLAEAWRIPPSELPDWHTISLPKAGDLSFSRYGNDRQVRAFDYNLFAQETFAGWVRELVSTVRSTGSHQLINVGQDEGGVADRVLNQFYATAGVSFTTNHTYWHDDALLWDAVVAKRPGMPNIVGETGYQPAWDADGSWRYDEVTGAGIQERKWALGFAAGSSGALQWDWAKEVDFGMQRSDGSAKIWEPMMEAFGAFARAATPYATGLTLPEVAIVLPQSLQMSTRNAEALRAQQAAVRVLYQYNRREAYAVGEFQMETLGTPKLILLPSAYGLTEAAWSAIEARVRAGAVLLASGPFGGDEHMHATDRERKLGLETKLVPLQQRDELLHSPAGDIPLVFDGLTTTMLDRETLPAGANFTEVSLGKGKILFSALPLELNTNLNSISRIYAYALKTAHVQQTYQTALANPGILICPTRLPHATLYVLTSETEGTSVSFADARSGRSFSGWLDAGRAALLMIGEKGDLLTSYGWHERKEARSSSR